MYWEISRYLTTIGFDTVGFDLSEDAIKIAKKIEPDGNFHICDATDLNNKISSQSMT